jgi:hypothetical protein
MPERYPKIRLSIEMAQLGDAHHQRAVGSFTAGLANVPVTVIV